ncbi:MAG: acyl-CoA thioesterase [Planctomycetes bacterium]|nr:acyl-CoA thioesterase [Planctomycetota bacterium]
MHVTETRVRYADTDAMGVVHHANYLVYFEIGRTELIRREGLPYADLERDGLRLAVVEAALRYRHPARYDDALLIATAVTEVTGVRIRFEYVISLQASGRPLVEGHTVLASLDERGRPRRLPPELRAALEGMVEAGADEDR